MKNSFPDLIWLLQYRVILFGFSNTLANFQGYINKILDNKLDISIIIYLNEILIYVKNLDQTHIKAIH